MQMSDKQRAKALKEKEKLLKEKEKAKALKEIKSRTRSNGGREEIVNSDSDILLLNKLAEFIRKHTQNTGWVEKFELHKDVCKILDSNKIFTGNIDAAEILISTKFPEIYNLSTKKLMQMFPNENKTHGCKEAVFGTLEDLAIYFMYNKKVDKRFILSSSAVWTETLNKILVFCGMESYLNNQHTRCSIRLLVPYNFDKLLNNNVPQITLLEFSMIFNKLYNYTTKIIDNKKTQQYIILLTKSKILPSHSGEATSTFFEESDTNVKFSRHCMGMDKTTTKK
jgi:hypothetical protein